MENIASRNTKCIGQVKDLLLAADGGLYFGSEHASDLDCGKSNTTTAAVDENRLKSNRVSVRFSSLYYSTMLNQECSSYLAFLQMRDINEGINGCRIDNRHRRAINKTHLVRELFA